MSAAAISRLHRHAIARMQSYKSSLDRKKQSIVAVTSMVLASVETTLGGASAAAIDHYMGPKGIEYPEAMIGPVPVAMAAAVGGALLGLAMHKEETGRHIANFANGLAAGVANSETHRFLRNLPAAA